MSGFYLIFEVAVFLLKDCSYGFVPLMFTFTLKLVMSLMVEDTVNVRVAVTTCPG